MPAFQKVNSKPNAVHSMASTKTAPARASVAQTTDHRAPKPAASATHTSTHTGTRTQSSAPRAGALTPDDF
jgi:hypothetical protein